MALRYESWRNFSGGINTRDTVSELAENEFPYSMNVTLDERGGVQKRLGYENRFGSAVGSGLVSNAFYWAANNQLVTQIGTGMHIDNGASFHTWSTTARCGMCEFAGNLIMIHPVDGMKVYNGVSVTTPTNAPLGNTCATWQNRVWSAGEIANPPRVHYSDIGSPNATATTQYVDLREKDSALITCLAGASGMDISGRPGLLAFKQDSAYRIYDSNTGAYTTIDASVGCGSNIGAVNAYGRTYAISTKGIYSTDGLSPMREDSQLIEDFFHEDSINQTRPDLMAAGRYQDRLRFSVPLTGATANGQALELHPLQNWIVPHTDAASCYASIGRNVTDLVMGSPSVAGRTYNAYVGGSDAGAAIASTFRTNWLEPAGGNLSRVRRLRFVGAGVWTATLLKNYQRGQGSRNLSVNIEDDVPQWDQAGVKWDAGFHWGPGAFQGKADFYSLGIYRAISVQISETSSLTLNGPPGISDATPEQGAWSLAYAQMMVLDLGQL